MAQSYLDIAANKEFCYLMPCWHNSSAVRQFSGLLPTAWWPVSSGPRVVSCRLVIRAGKRGGSGLGLGWTDNRQHQISNPGSRWKNAILKPDILLLACSLHTHFGTKSFPNSSTSVDRMQPWSKGTNLPFPSPSPMQDAAQALLVWLHQYYKVG